MDEATVCRFVLRRLLRSRRSNRRCRRMSRSRLNITTSDADIALDELISQIVVSTSDKAGNEFSRATIDPNTVPLNPNRAPLYYSATLYHPPQNGRSLYLARIQVFGNYE